jgi:hypothetical protein
MPTLNEATEQDRVEKGVFQPSRAEIAREMKCRLNLGVFDKRRTRRTQSAK